MLVSRPEFEPHVVEGSVEAWIGRHFRDRFARDSAHCDFWRAHPAGVFFLVRGYDEDASTSVLPATIVDITLPIWRIGEAMLYASRIARAYAENPEIEIHCRFTNLKDRRLGSLDKMRHFFMGDDRVCLDEEARLNARATATEVDENLVEILQPLLRPLYERFSFFELSLDLVREEVARLRKNRL